MATLDEIGQEKQRISERLARLDGKRTKLGNQLSELEIAERILARFGGTAEATEKRRRGRRARTAPAAGGQRSARGGQQAPTVSMSDGILKAVQAHAGHCLLVVARCRPAGGALPSDIHGDHAEVPRQVRHDVVELPPCLWPAS
jgi:hypothetical protein